MKAFNIIQTELANSDLREANRQNRSLFHAKMSFLENISHLMEESGFRGILKLTYLSIKCCGPRKSTESSSDRMQQHFSPVWSWQGNSPVEIWEFILFRKHVSRCHCYTCYMYYAVLAIFLAGEKALVFLFGVKPVIGLDALRHWQNLLRRHLINSHNSFPNCNSDLISQPARLSTSKAVAGRRWKKVYRGLERNSMVMRNCLSQRICCLLQTLFFS